MVRNTYKLILEGKMPFDESNFEFEIENPNQEELDSQIALLKHRLKTDLPSGSQYDEPEDYRRNKTGIPALDSTRGDREENKSEPETTTEKLASGFGFYAYTANDREGTGVTYIGEWLNYKRHGRGVLRNHRDQWEYRGTTKPH